MLASVSGVLGGPVQTVTRAELVAFVEALRSTAQNVSVISDTAYVVNEFAKLQQGISPSKHHDLWAVLRRAIRARLDRRIAALRLKRIPRSRALRLAAMALLTTPVMAIS